MSRLEKTVKLVTVIKLVKLVNTLTLTILGFLFVYRIENSTY